MYVCNLNPQVPETVGYSVADHVRALQRHGLTPDVVLYDSDSAGLATADAVSEELGELVSTRAVPGLLAAQSATAHDPALLGAALAELLAHASTGVVLPTAL
ncbi:unannotated protein [freshwater metagenome]|uniref:Unannotated protein n=1 Tax=freshwater metagenome TaxID=449393 RepID=A0A6J7SN02_9ZZZZ